jgi:Flp pilus assembly protein TadB
MSFGLPISEIVELTLAVLLAATLFCCSTLERRLRGLRKDQEMLAATVRSLNAGIAAASASLAALKAAAKDADEQLAPKVKHARGLVDELSLLTASGERIAARIESAGNRPARHERSNAPALAEALRAVR